MFNLHIVVTGNRREGYAIYDVTAGNRRIISFCDTPREVAQQVSKIDWTHLVNESDIDGAYTEER